ncbi:MAG: hypothetical protein NC112_04980 [Oxalobacter formigenes]|nr:hypothetical protein [Oxalobacter formigenes]
MIFLKHRKQLFFLILLIIALSLSAKLAWKKIKSYRSEIKTMKQEITHLYLIRDIEKHLRENPAYPQRFFNHDGYSSKEAYIAHGGGGLASLPTPTPKRLFWIPSRKISGL